MYYVVRWVFNKGRTTCLRYHTKGHCENPTVNAEEKTKEDAILKQLNRNAYNDLILAQDHTLCLQII